VDGAANLSSFRVVFTANLSSFKVVFTANLSSFDLYTPYISKAAEELKTRKINKQERTIKGKACG
jgi:hypothetical protein